MNDQEILALMAEAREKIRRELQEDLDKLVQKEKQAMLEHFRIAKYIIKWSVAVLTLICMLLGYTAWTNMRKDIEDWWKEKLETTYDVDNLSSPFRIEADSLRDQALVNSLYVYVQRKNASEGDTSRIFRDKDERLGPAELARLLNIFTLQKSSAALFEDALVVVDA